MSVDISQLTESLPAEQRKAVQAAYKRQAKDATTAFLLCFFLGIFGIHCFYLGRVGQGIFRLIISPLIIPGLIWEVVDLPRIDREVHARNLKLAEQLVAGAMLAVPNSAALEAALSQLDATLHAQETQAVAAPAPADVAEPAAVPVSAPEPINPAAGRADEPGGAVADAALPPAGLDAAAEADAPAFAAPEDVANAAAPQADDVPVGLHGTVVPEAEPEAEPVAEPAPAPAAYEWAPQWPVDAAVALAAEHAALAETARDAVTASTAQERSSVDAPADVTSTMWDAAPVVEQSAAEVPAAPAEAATAWADEATGAPEPGTAALAFGWLQAAASGAADAPESAAAPESSAEPAPDPVDAWDTPTFVVPRAEPPAARAAAAWGAGDPTDQGMPLEEFGGTADPGELASADRVSVALAEGATEWPADGSVFEQDDGPQSVAVPGTDATEEPDAEQGAEPGAEPGAGETQSPVLVFVADEGSEPELRLTSDEVTLASLAGLAAASSVASAGSEAGAEQASMPAEDAQPGGTLAGAMETGTATEMATGTEVPAPATDYRAEVMEEPHPSPAAPGAEQRRMVKRVRVVRRLVVNGQVVRETAAEQVIDADADAQEAAAELQRTLGSADPETLAALADALDEPPAAPAQAPTPPAAAPDGPPAAREGPRQ